ncbi:helix-turn-helix domain-containing protein [Aureispira anguillae]|uniref:AraC family transcriptional regulator n=1 Tax=Aureispira anguillae TaxID=2864201 RepID=A0A916DRT1_9BACT|nr:AraC family transcriptional regulator [Aureispira anguillae]BDS10391.1 AraC family transcriptional regulator [Aureispira anguillae]
MLICNKIDPLSTMPVKTIEIPQFFLPEQHEQLLDSTFIKVYQSSQESIKSKIKLSGFLFNFVLEGTKQLNTLEDSVQVNASKLVLIKPSHCLMTEKLSQNQSYKSLLCFFSPSLISTILSQYDLEAIPNHNQDNFFLLETDDYTQNFVQSILLLKKSNSLLHENLVQLKIKELMLYLIHQKGHPLLNFFRSAYPSEVDLNFEQIVKKHINTKLTVEELAFLAHMSVSTFKRKFKQRYNASPAKWFQQKRLQKAKQLLSSLQKTPSQIYMEVGFENFSSFSQAFKKEFGQSPKQYQKKFSSTMQ